MARNSQRAAFAAKRAIPPSYDDRRLAEAFAGAQPFEVHQPHDTSAHGFQTEEDVRRFNALREQGAETGR